MKKLLSVLLLTAAATTNAADYWERIPVPVSKHLLTVSFGAPLVGYIGGTDSTLLKTVDGGASWKAQKTTGMSFTSASPDIIDLNFVSATTGYAVVGSRTTPEFQGTLYKTIDGGTNWMPESPTIAVATCYFFDGDNGFVAGSGFFSGRTIQQMSGGSWMPAVHHHFGPSSFLKTIDFWDKNTGIIGGDDGMVYRTFDGGASWDTVKTNIDTTIGGILFISKDTIVAASSNNGAAILISVDKGKTWAFDPFSMTFYYPALKAVTISQKDSLIFAGHSETTGKGIVYDFSGGHMNIFNTSQDLNDVGMADDSIAFIAGDSGLLLSNRHISTQIQESTAFKNRVRIFPNPVEQQLTIESAVPCEATLFDMQGRLLWQSKSASLAHEINVRQFPKGVLMLRVLTADGETKFQKLLLQ